MTQNEHRPAAFRDGDGAAQSPSIIARAADMAAGLRRARNHALARREARKLDPFDERFSLRRWQRVFGPIRGGDE